MSKYHKGDKFIVEIKEVMNSDNGTLYRSNFKTLTFDDYGLDSLTQAITPAEDGLVDKAKVDEAYNEGLNDAWELAKKIYCFEEDGGMECEILYKIFNVRNVAKIAKNYTVQEALAKLEAYEKEQKEQNEIKVGDIVTTINGECNYIVTKIQLPNTLHCINSRNGFALQMKIGCAKKTGKHIEIQSLLEQIKE